MDTETTKEPIIPLPKKSPLIVRILLRVLVSILILFVLTLGAAFIIGYYYQDEVKEFVVGELNKQLNTEVIVDGKDIDFTVIQNFPYASVDFKNVKALDAIEKQKKDTLFSAGKISFQFNLVDILKKKYDIKRIRVDDVNLSLRIDKNGNDNYHFWKTSPDSGAVAFSFALKKIVLNRVHVQYKNSQTHQKIDILIKTSTSSGKFSNEKYLMKTNSDLLVNDLTLDRTNYLHKKNVKAEVELAVDKTIASYKLENGKIKIEDLLFEVVGNVVNTGSESLVNLGLKGKNMDIKSVLSLIPDKYKNRINEYESSGEFYFNAIIEGSVSKNKLPHIKADFGIKNADITHIKNNIVLHHVNLKGRYFSGNKEIQEISSLELRPFSATIGEAAVNGELLLRDLNNPSVSAKIKGEMGLEKLQDFIRIDTIERITGLLKIDASFNGDAKEFNSGNYRNITAGGKLALENVDLKIKNNSLAFANINGDFTFDNNDLEINNFAGNISKTDFELKGFLRNCMGFILKENQDITIDAKLNSKNVDLNELLANKEENKSSKSKYKLKFSEHINVNLNSTIERLVFRKFEATAIKGVIRLQEKKMVVDSLSFSTMNGKIAVGGLVDGSDSAHVLVTCFSDISRVNVTKLFTAFENFSQTFITDKNIKGNVTAKIQFASVYSPELDIDMDKLYAGIDMAVENGELNNVESMKKLSRFIELKELENIRFSTFKNQFEVKNKVITLPKMEIKTNAMNFSASGTHTFSNEINYKIKLSLNELLAKKIRKPKKGDNEFGEIADDGLGRTNIFLLMTGTAESPVIRYDTKGAVDNVKQDLKVEKQSLKKILNEEFGLFKKDTSLHNRTNVKKEDQTKFTIKWEEADVKEEKKELKKPKRKEEDDF
jgi:hypothetical protein